MKDEEYDLPSLHWIPKLHKRPYKQLYIAGAAMCSFKSLSELWTYIPTIVKIDLQGYHDTSLF